MVKYPKKIFVKSLAITLVVFMMGVLLGWSLDKYREDELAKDMRINELDTQSYFLERDFIEKAGKNVCGIFNTRIKTLTYTLGKVGSELPTSEDNSMSKNLDLDYLKRKYTISEVQYFMLLQDMKEKCGESFTPILFFYTKDDSTSKNQGLVLDWIGEKYKDNVVILSFDNDYIDEPLINTLKLHYRVNSKSAIVFNDNTYNGFVSKEEISNLIQPLLSIENKSS